ncbi:hypothetical protein TVAG_339400 [Trichomonas vaginalis G3]|uniref:Uncharacterized protein n=1 Tax=Trichomonas vaginalis (strain ATCC PRA-98 / G3) TaxID=412133 RepID=A2F8Z6_TRIV3|nr:hypothetical protein TVAGG3_0764190 [Trichomonas vaginalis G3]EAX98623.1 hypothetical protein TVAG_339400 [Trichomonas vaginalis G3]KAI5513420.1 hypothetical protein TVAGG3_0764190 [Trichomonas vaginalis G3]|eukprot:XP_001311553.1 hypothetical protein [Trichomonas vaginalis G3]
MNTFIVIIIVLIIVAILIVNLGNGNSPLDLYEWLFGSGQGYQIVRTQNPQNRQRLAPVFINNDEKQFNVGFSPRSNGFEEQNLILQKSKLNRIYQNTLPVQTNTQTVPQSQSKFPDISKEKGGFSYLPHTMQVPLEPDPEPVIIVIDEPPPAAAPKPEKIYTGRAYDWDISSDEEPPKPAPQPKKSPFEQKPRPQYNKPAPEQQNRQAKTENTERKPNSNYRGGRTSSNYRGRGRGTNRFIKSGRTAKPETRAKQE